MSAVWVFYGNTMYQTCKLLVSNVHFSLWSPDWRNWNN